MIAALLLLAQAAPTPATPPPRPPATMVIEPVGMAIVGFDADGDGRTTRAEFDAGVRRSFDAIDTGHTGSLGYIGYSDWALLWLGDRNALPSPFDIDTDGDDRITFAELQAQLARTFARLDRDNDGAVTRAEALTIRATVPDDRPQRHRGDGVKVRPTGGSSQP